MNYTSDDILRELVTAIEHVGANRYAGAGGSDQKEELTTRQKLQKAADTASKGLYAMEGSTQAAAHAFRTMVGSTMLGGAIDAVIHSISNASQVYSKLSDVGLTFNGSLGEMEKAAADSGLSLDEFARSMQKNSTVVALMGDAHQDGVKQFAQYQKGVRDNLREFGYFGMSLSQVNEVTGAFAEDMRRSGQLNRLSDKQLAKAGSDYIAQVNAMSHATGKSRDEIMKLTNQAFNDPAAAIRLQQLGQSASRTFTNATVTFASAMGHAGEELSKMFAQTVGSKGRGWATELGQAAIEAGVPELNTLMEQAAQLQNAGKENSDEFVDVMVNIKDTLQKHSDSLLDLKLDPKVAGSANRLLALLADLAGFNREKALERERKAREEAETGFTQSVQMFETNIQELTASFRRGIFGTMLGLSNTKKNDKERAEAAEREATTLKTLNAALEDFGKAIGVMAGLFVDVLPWFGKFVQVLAWGVDKIKSAFQLFFGKTGGSLLTTGLLVGGGIMAKRALSRAMRVDARIVNIYTKDFKADGRSLSDHFGDVRDRARSVRDAYKSGGMKGAFRHVLGRGTANVAQSELGLGGGGIKGAGGIWSMIKGNVGSLFKGGGILKGIGKGLIAAVVSRLFDAFLNIFGEFKGKKTLSSMASYGGTGAWIGSLIMPGVGTVVGAIVGAILGAFIENFHSIVDGIGSMFGNLWSDLKWAVKKVIKYGLFGGVIEIMIENFKAITAKLPEWVRKMLGIQSCPNAAAAPPDERQTAGAASQMAPEIEQLKNTMAQMRVNPEMTTNADQISNALSAITPEIMNSTIRRIQTDPDRSFLSAPIQDNDSFETLSKRLIDVTALMALDKEKTKEGDTGANAEWQKAMLEQMTLNRALLDRGNRQREQSTRRNPFAAQ